MRVPRMSAVAFRRLTTANLLLLVAVIASGAIVRLSNSGLGCPDWPNCNAADFVNVETHHAAIEQLNRIFSGLIGIPLGFAVLGAYQLRPQRRDLVRLAWLLFGLFWCEAIIGGISVQVQLAWFSVMSHFLLALALVSIAIQMWVRVREPAGRRTSIVARPAALLVRAVFLLTIGVVILGTLVTAAGPHGGDEEAERLTIPIRDLARVHGLAVDILVVLTLVTTYVLVRTRAPRRVINAASVAVGAMVAQGVLGYVQYANGIPPVLVGFHVFGAVVVFAAVQYLDLSTRAPITGSLSVRPNGTPAAAADEPRRTSTPVGDPVA